MAAFISPDFYLHLAKFMKPPSIPLEKITALTPIYRFTVPSDYEDRNGHMNVRWYLHIFDDAGDVLVEQFGITPEFHRQNGTGGFDLEHHLHYLKEVHIGDTVVVYARMIGRSAKRIHYVLLMVNETRETLAAIQEVVNSFADMKIRRTASYPDEVAMKIDAMLTQHQALDWESPISGVMHA
ncbi:MAG TPA: thioesterase family protein [Phototrophicaceae bacterium]|jgi:acyl-CoA thioester hydrolase|nr:thioesterase family protein [Phototrophicaceae bacterium]